MKHPTKRQLAAYVLGQLAGEEREQIERHLETCEECRAGVEREKSLDRVIRRSLAGNIGGSPSRVTFHDLLPRLQRTRKMAQQRRLVAAWALGATAVAALGLSLLAGLVGLLTPVQTAGNPYTASPTGEPDPTSPLSPATPGERVRVRWHVAEEEGAGAGVRAAAQAFAQVYNASQGRIEIVLDLGPQEVKHVSNIAMLDQVAIANSPPSVVGPLTTEGVRQVAGETPGAWLSPEPWLSAADLADIDPAVLNAWRVEGNLAALPIGTYPSVLAYNRGLFDAAGLAYPPTAYGEWTVEEMARTARRLTVDVASNMSVNLGFDPANIVRWGFQGTTDDLATSLNLFGGGSFQDEEGNVRIPTNWRAATYWYRDAVCEDHLHLSAAAYTEGKLSPFRSGVVGMVYGPLWIVNQLGTEQDWDLAAAPAYEGEAGPSVDVGIAVGVLATTAHPDEAIEVARAIASSPEMAAAWGAYPARESVQGPFLAEMAARYPDVRWDVVVDAVERGELVDSGMPTVEVWSDGEELLARIESGEICTVDVDDEIERLEASLVASLSSGGE